MARLLGCGVCQTLEKLPDFKGRPEDDVLLDDLVQRHVRKHGETNEAYLFGLDDETYDRLDGLTQIKSELAKQTGKQFEDKDTYTEDAGKCYNAHGRPKDGCIDYHDDRKRIGNPTQEGWREGKVKVYLCDFCPVSSVVMTKKRLKRGMYK